VNDVHVTCCEDRCGIEFCLPKSVYERRLEDHKLFYCPNGHSQHFAAESESEKKIRAARKSADWWREYAHSVERQRDEARHEVRSLRSRLSWARRRVAA
jgi:hypothetical protein